MWQRLFLMDSNLQIKRFPDASAMSGEVHSLLTSFMAQPVAPRAKHPLYMLSGGGTPMAAYSRLAETPLSVRSDALVLLSDERAVPDDSPKSNQGGIFPLLRKAGFDDSQLLSVETTLEPSVAASRWDERLAAILETHSPATGLLGLGTDGHTAGLFTLEQLARAEQRLAIAVQRPDRMEGITTTPSFLTRFPRLIVLVAGAAKYAPLHAWIQGDDTLVARAALRAAPSVEIWCDNAAWSGKEIS